jgi:hypothetical protein
VTPGSGVARAAGDPRVSHLLHAFFDDGEAADLFIVLRNGELLPDDFAGNDLDISVLPGRTVEEVVRRLVAKAGAVGWQPICVSRRWQMTGLSLVSPGLPPLALHFDVFAGITGFGISLVTPEVLGAESEVRSGVRQLSRRGRALATMAHHVVAAGMLSKPKYLDELRDVLVRPEDRAWLQAMTRHSLGAKLAACMEHPAAIDQLASPSWRRRVDALWGAARQGGRLRTRVVLPAVARYLRGQIPSLLRPPGVIGSAGDRIRDLPGFRLSPELACGIAPLAMIAAHARVKPEDVRTLNSAKHHRAIVRIWRSWTAVRWICPSGFLWLQAKRNRVIVLDRLPTIIRVLRRVAHPRWIAASGTG